MNYHLILEPPDELKSRVLESLRAFNRVVNPLFYAKLDAPGNVRPLNLFAFRDNRTLAGGLLGLTQLTWLKTEILFVDESDRKCGVGSS